MNDVTNPIPEIQPEVKRVEHPWGAFSPYVFTDITRYEDDFKRSELGE